jgi:hypothetical protein
MKTERDNTIGKLNEHENGTNYSKVPYIEPTGGQL